MLKEQKGITLVALVVTIIVLLILAGVTITLVLGQNGIIGKAQNAQVEQDKAYAHDIVSTALKAVEIDAMTTNTLTTDALKMTSLLNAIDNSAFTNEAADGATKVTYKKDGKSYVVTVEYTNYTVTNVAEK